MRQAPKLDPKEEHFCIPGERAGLNIFLRYLAHTKPSELFSEHRFVLYVHGATFPSALSIAHRIDGRSWRDELAASGFRVWGLDFQGFTRKSAAMRFTGRRRRS